jgi:hypothetical protein
MIYTCSSFFLFKQKDDIAQEQDETNKLMHILRHESFKDVIKKETQNLI